MKKISVQISIFVCAAFLFCGTKCYAQWNDEELRFPHHYSELIGSYQDYQMFVGANYTYIPKKWGLYGSFMYGFQGDYCANVGPAIRLANSSFTGVDIHLFQGVGLNSGSLGGETGVRFGFGRDKKYGMWSLSGSLCYSSEGIGWSVGMSWPIAGITAGSALILGYAVLVAYSGANVSVPSTVSSGSSSSSSDNAVSSGSTTDCSFWQSKYREAEQHVEKLYNDIKDLQRTSPTQTALTGMKKNYRDAQQNLKKWRTNAKEKGCTISASVWETKSL